MKSLKIEIPEGYEIDQFDKDTGEITFKSVEKETTPEDIFHEIFDGCIIRFNTKIYPDSIFYFDVDGNFLAQYVSKNNTIWFKESIIRPIEKKIVPVVSFQGYDSIKMELHNLIKTHLKLNISNVFVTQEKTALTIEKYFNILKRWKV